MAFQVPGLLTSSIPAMLMPRNASSAARRSRARLPLIPIASPSRPSSPPLPSPPPPPLSRHRHGLLFRAIFPAAPVAPAPGVSMRPFGWCATAVLAALVAGRSPLAAQRRELTVIAGMNYSGATGGNFQKTESRAGFLAGVSLRMPRSARVSFQTEFLLVERRLFGQRAPSTLPPLQVGPISDAAKLLYAEIPITLRFQRGYSTLKPVRPFFVLGPYLGIRLGSPREVLEGDSPGGCPGR